MSLPLAVPESVPDSVPDTVPDTLGQLAAIFDASEKKKKKKHKTLSTKPTSQDDGPVDGPPDGADLLFEALNDSQSFYGVDEYGNEYDTQDFFDLISFGFKTVCVFLTWSRSNLVLTCICRGAGSLCGASRSQMTGAHRMQTSLRHRQPSRKRIRRIKTSEAW